jgi:hypothetical protein
MIKNLHRAQKKKKRKEKMMMMMIKKKNREIINTPYDKIFELHLIFFLFSIN